MKQKQRENLMKAASEKATQRRCHFFDKLFFATGATLKPARSNRPLQPQ